MIVVLYGWYRFFIGFFIFIYKVLRVVSFLYSGCFFLQLIFLEIQMKIVVFFMIQFCYFLSMIFVLFGWLRKFLIRVGWKRRISFFFFMRGSEESSMFNFYNRIFITEIEEQRRVVYCFWKFDFICIF